MMTKAQATLENLVLIAIVAIALVTMQVYLKRAFQGRYKSSVDDLGSPYDPQHTTSEITLSITSNSFTNFYTENRVLVPGQGNVLVGISNITFNEETSREGWQNIEAYGNLFED